MKKIMFVCAVMFFTGCSYSVLSSSTKPMVRQMGPTSLTCANINEWNLSMDEKKFKTGCWCMLPPISTFFGPGVLFINVYDEFCDPNVTQEQLEKM